MRVTHSDDGRLAYVECVNSRHSWRLHCAANVWTRVDPRADSAVDSCGVDRTPPAADDDDGDAGRLMTARFHRTFLYRSQLPPSLLSQCSLID